MALHGVWKTMTRTFFTVNPATEERMRTYRLCTLTQIKRSLKKAAASFQRWKQYSAEERAQHFTSLSRLLLREKKSLARLMTIEMGKPVTEAAAEIEKCSLACTYFAEHAADFLQPEKINTENKRSYVRFDPLGTVLAIMPWNFPFWQVFRCAVPALCAGNVVVLKHSNQVPGCALGIQRLFRESGFPSGVFTALLANSSQVSQIIPSVHAVSLTGSVHAGQSVAEQAGKHLKKIVLELGGMDPFVVLEDADVNMACQTAIKSRFINSGQSCIAAKRFIVVKKRYQEFIGAVVEATRRLIVGDPLASRTQVGPLANSQQLRTLERQVHTSARMRARVECGGQRLQRTGYFFAPTVLTRVTKGMPVLLEEVFGPVMPVQVVKNDHEALQEANASSFGLGASVWTRNRAKGERMAREIEAGVVAVNSIVKSDPRLPFGGVKNSGIGRELSRYGLLEFTNIKSVVVN